MHDAGQPSTVGHELFNGEQFNAETVADVGILAQKAKGECLHYTAFMCLENQQEVAESQLKRGGKIVWGVQAGEKHPIYMESSNGKQVREFINYIPGQPEET